MGPLQGIRVVEVAGIGPGPFCGMMLADMGADVVRIDRADRIKAAGAPSRRSTDPLNRGRRSIAVDLRTPEGVELVLRMVEQADVIFEGFRPGVMERMGLGPDVCLARNPTVVYGRMTGWGQEGPLAQGAGHDINYIAVTGALHSIGTRGGPPIPPLNLVGDFGGGGMLLAFGITCALLETRQSGKGQVVDAAMVDGASLLMSMFHGMRAAGGFSDERGTNVLDGSAPYYGTYETADGKYIALGSLEPQFFAELLRRTGLNPEEYPQQDRAKWPAMQKALATTFKQRTRDEWSALMEGTDVCFGPVLSIGEAYEHPHNKQRGAFVEIDGIPQPAPGPRFSRTPGQAGRIAVPGEHADGLLAEFGFSASAVSALRASGAIV